MWRSAQKHLAPHGRYFDVPQAVPQGGIDVGIGAEGLGAPLGASLRSLCDLIGATLRFHKLFHGLEWLVECPLWTIPRGGIDVGIGAGALGAQFIDDTLTFHRLFHGVE